MNIHMKKAIFVIILLLTNVKADFTIYPEDATYPDGDIAAKTGEIVISRVVFSSSTSTTINDPLNGGTISATNQVRLRS